MVAALGADSADLLLCAAACCGVLRCAVQDVEFAFEKARLPEWIADIKHLIKKDLRSIPGWYAHRRYAAMYSMHRQWGRPPGSAHMQY